MSKEQINLTAQTVHYNDTQENRTAFTDALTQAYEANAGWIATHQIPFIATSILWFAATHKCTRALRLLLKDENIDPRTEPILVRTSDPDTLKLLLSWRGKNGEYIDINDLNKLNPANNIKDSIVLHQEFPLERLTQVLKWKGGNGESFQLGREDRKLSNFAVQCARSGDMEGDNHSYNLCLALAFAKTLDAPNPNRFNNIMNKVCAATPSAREAREVLEKKAEYYASIINNYGLDAVCAIIQSIESPYTTESLNPDYSYEYKPNSPELLKLVRDAQIKTLTPELNAIARVAKNPITAFTNSTPLPIDAFSVVLGHLTSPATDSNIAKGALKSMSLAYKGSWRREIRHEALENKEQRDRQ